MIFILANILFSSVFTLCIKWVQVLKRDDMITIGMINYVVAAVVTAWRNPVGFNVTTWNPYAAAYGINMGVTYFVAFFFVVYAVRVIGAAASTVVGSLALVVPIIAAAFIWDDVPNGLEILGIVIALFSLSLIGTSRVKDEPTSSTENENSEATANTKSRTESSGDFWKTTWVLIAFFLLCGNSRLSQEGLKHVRGSALPSHQVNSVQEEVVETNDDGKEDDGKEDDGKEDDGKEDDGKEDDGKEDDGTKKRQSEFCWRLF